MNIIIVIALLFFCIDIKYYKPKDFLKHKLAVSFLFLHHLFVAFILVGWFAGYRSILLYVSVVLTVIIGWKLFNNKCLLSMATNALGPKDQPYCPFMGPFHLFTNGEKNCIELYFKEEQNENKNAL